MEVWIVFVNCLPGELIGFREIHQGENTLFVPFAPDLSFLGLA